MLIDRDYLSIPLWWLQCSLPPTRVMASPFPVLRHRSVWGTCVGYPKVAATFFPFREKMSLSLFVCCAHHFSLASHRLAVLPIRGIPTRMSISDNALIAMPVAGAPEPPSRPARGTVAAQKRCSEEMQDPGPEE